MDERLLIDGIYNFLQSSAQININLSIQLAQDNPNAWFKALCRYSDGYEVSAENMSINKPLPYVDISEDALIDAVVKRNIKVERHFVFISHSIVLQGGPFDYDLMSKKRMQIKTPDDLRARLYDIDYAFRYTRGQETEEIYRMKVELEMYIRHYYMPILGILEKAQFEPYKHIEIMEQDGKVTVDSAYDIETVGDGLAVIWKHLNDLTDGQPTG